MCTTHLATTETFPQDERVLTQPELGGELATRVAPSAGKHGELAMRNSRDLVTLWSTGAAAAVGLFALSFASSAAADEACGETPCPLGFECETMAAPCPDIACAPGEDCDLGCDGAPQSYCVRAACESDADCGEHLVCASLERMDCTNATRPACAPGEACEELPIEESGCATTTIKECTPRWDLPCTSAADCGEGFSCQELESCSCAGSGGAEPAPSRLPAEGGGADSLAAPDEPVELVASPDCTCAPSGEFMCQRNEVACDSDADCPTDWSCVDNPMGYCWQSSDGTSGCEPADSARICQEPYANLGGGFADLALAASSGSADATSAGEAPMIAEVNGAQDTAATATDGADSSASSSGGGCSLSTESKGDAGLMGLLLGLGVVLGTRRRRRIE